MFGDSPESEMDIDTTMETKPTIDREKKLREVEEKLLSKRTNERFLTNYEGVMFDPNLTLAPKIIHLQKQLMMQQEERFSALHSKVNYLKNAFINGRKFMKKIWRKQRLQDRGCNFYENALDYNQIKFFTAPLSYICCNFKIIEEIRERDKEKWK